MVIDYVAPAECPPAAAFGNDVVARLPQDRTVSLGPVGAAVPGTLGLQVRVNKYGAGYRAELTTITEEGRSTPRNLDGPVCAELMDAMAFTAALTVDPNATALPSPPTSETLEPGSTHDVAPEPAETPGPDIGETPTSSSGTELTIDTEPTAPAPSTEPPHVPEWATSLFAGLVLTAPVTPGVSPGLLAGLRYSDEAPGRWSPAISVAILGTQLVASYSPNSSFAAVGAHLEFCPSSFRDHSITIRPCVAGQLTMLRAAGVNLTHNDRVTVALPSLGGHIELRHTLSSRWFVAGLGGVQVALQRHRFEVGLPSEEVATTRVVAPFVSLQLGAFLP